MSQSPWLARTSSEAAFLQHTVPEAGCPDRGAHSNLPTLASLGSCFPPHHWEQEKEKAVEALGVSANLN